MEATTLPTLLLGGDPDGDPEETYAALARRRSRCPRVRGLVVGRTLLYPPDDDVPAPSTPRSRWCGDRACAQVGTDRRAGDDLHLPGRVTPPGRFDLRGHAGVGRLGATPACGCSTLAPGELARVRHRRRRDDRAAAVRRRATVTVRRRARSSWPAGRACSTGSTDFAYLPRRRARRR